MSKFIDLEPRYHKEDSTYNIRGYVDYVKGVLDGSIIAGEYIKLACQRVLDFDDNPDMYFDYLDVDRRVNFIYKLKHTEAPWTDKPFKLLSWQLFIISQIYGWKWKSNDRRVTRKVFLMIARKNGKSSLASAISLCNLVCDNERGIEVDLVANSSKQAAICYKYISNYAKSVDPKKKFFKTMRSELRVPSSNSNVQILCSDSMSNDGYNSSLCIFDELHAAKDWDLYNVMKSSQGARPQPLMVTITTAGFMVGEMYPCYSMWQMCISILRGELSDDTQFSAIYQLDEHDDWEDESVWKKCCPSLGESVFIDNMRDELTMAKNNKSLEVNCRTKIFNQWCQSSEVWLPYDLLSSNMRPFKLEDLLELSQSTYAFVGVDFSAVSDLTALSVCVKSEETFYIKTYYFFPEEQLDDNAFGSLYREWASKGYMHITPGNVQDYNYALALVHKIDGVLPIQGIYFDPWNSLEFNVNATNDGLPMNPFSQALGNFNAPTKQFELLLRRGQIVMDYNPCTIWCFNNAVLKFDFNNNCKPVKANQRGGKIDGVISIIESLGGYYIENNAELNVTAM